MQKHKSTEIQVDIGTFETNKKQIRHVPNLQKLLFVYFSVVGVNPIRL